MTAVVAGALSLISIQSTTASLSSAVATGGTGPYTYQWYRSTTSGFTPGGGNLIAGATALTLNDSGLIPNTSYFWKVVATDSLAATGTSSQLAASTSVPVLNPNQFQLSPFLGQIDLRFDYNTTSALIDVSQSTPLYAGSAVKVVDSADGVPKVVGCAANSDEVWGFINFDIKTVQFLAGVPCEVSQKGNVMFLYATTAISRSAQVQLDLSTNGGVAAVVPSSGADIVGYAFDKAAAPGALIRVAIQTPSFSKA
jgi:hypothetical protein